MTSEEALLNAAGLVQLRYGYTPVGREIADLLREMARKK